MTTPVNIEGPVDFAVRIVTAINILDTFHLPSMTPHTRADRERISSDLAGLGRHRPIASIELTGEYWCAACVGPDGFPAPRDVIGAPYPCADHIRYSEGLLRTGRVYGVTP